MEDLRAKLNDAMKTKEKDKLDKVINECVSAGMPELAADIQKARSVADILRGGTGGWYFFSILLSGIRSSITLVVTT